MSEDEEADAAAASGGGGGSVRRRRGKASEGFKEQVGMASCPAESGSGRLCTEHPLPCNTALQCRSQHVNHNPSALTATQTCSPPGLLLPPQVLEVLQRHGFLERRAAKMSQDDFLGLLAAFNQAGIHFTS